MRATGDYIKGVSWVTHRRTAWGQLTYEALCVCMRLSSLAGEAIGCVVWSTTSFLRHYCGPHEHCRAKNGAVPPNNPSPCWCRDARLQNSIRLEHTNQFETCWTSTTLRYRLHGGSPAYISGELSLSLFESSYRPAYFFHVSSHRLFYVFTVTVQQ